ncbi:hypothetical protein [Peptoniphilus obesi]|uniref:hypothetical protein n=1 Tax=Peptoniphilus obesi TaxID=1472765 RepID=UPI0004B8CB54|nr:hypothetical protein [Peptoniphilus obesi]
MKILKISNKDNINIYIISLVCIFLIAINLSSCVGMSQEERDKELIEKEDFILPKVWFKDYKSSEEVLKGMTKKEREEFMHDLYDAVCKYYEENKDFKVKDIVLKVLDDYDIDEDQLDKFNIRFNTLHMVDEKRYNIKFNNISMTYSYDEKNETDQDYFPGKTDEEIDEIINKIMEYAKETAKKGEEVKLSPEVMDELGIDSYNKDKLDEFTFQYSYIRDIE